MKTYEGLFILETAGKEENIKDLIDSVSSEITSGGAKIQNVQKMDKKSFARVANKRHTTGFYVNYIFEAEPEAAAQIPSRFERNDDVFRILITEASEGALAEPVADAAS